MRRCMLSIVPVLLLGWGMVVWAQDVEFGKLKSKTPANWKAVKPQNKFRVYQFAVPKVDGDKADAEVVIFFFEGGAGSAAENIMRQRKTFTAPEGQKVVSSMEQFKVGKVEVSYLDIAGTYLYKNPPFDPKAKEQRFEDYRMLYILFPMEEGLYTVRLVGPAKTVAANKKSFEEWVKNFK